MMNETITLYSIIQNEWDLTTKEIKNKFLNIFNVIILFFEFEFLPSWSTFYAIL